MPFAKTPSEFFEGTISKKSKKKIFNGEIF